MKRHHGQWLKVSVEIDDMVDVNGLRILVIADSKYDGPPYQLSKAWRRRLEPLN